MNRPRWTQPVVITVTFPDSVETYRDAVTFTTARGRSRAIRALEQRTLRARCSWKRIEWVFEPAWARSKIKGAQG